MVCEESGSRGSHQTEGSTRDRRIGDMEVHARLAGVLPLEALLGQPAVFRPVRHRDPQTPRIPRRDERPRAERDLDDTARRDRRHRRPLRLRETRDAPQPFPDRRVPGHLAPAMGKPESASRREPQPRQRQSRDRRRQAEHLQIPQRRPLADHDSRARVIRRNGRDARQRPFGKHQLPLRPARGAVQQLFFRISRASARPGGCGQRGRPQTVRPSLCQRGADSEQDRATGICGAAAKRRHQGQIRARGTEADGLSRGRTDRPRLPAEGNRRARQDQQRRRGRDSDIRRV